MAKAMSEDRRQMASRQAKKNLCRLRYDKVQTLWSENDLAQLEGDIREALYHEHGFWPDEIDGLGAIEWRPQELYESSDRAGWRPDEPELSLVTVWGAKLEQGRAANDCRQQHAY